MQPQPGFKPYTSAYIYLTDTQVIKLLWPCDMKVGILHGKSEFRMKQKTTAKHKFNLAAFFSPWIRGTKKTKNGSTRSCRSTFFSLSKVIFFQSK